MSVRCDADVHVVGAIERYPQIADRMYRAGVATLDAAARKGAPPPPDQVRGRLSPASRGRDDASGRSARRSSSASRCHVWTAPSGQGAFGRLI
jgi:hypothetical protein